MTAIDNKIVNMQFQNGQFEAGVSETIKSLDKLKEGLNLTESAKNLSQLQKAGEDFEMSNLEKAVESIADKFTLLGLIGITALQNIANSAIDAASQLVKSFTLDPITDGFSKYEQKTTSVQTIMNATGLEINEVNKSLDKLLWFTDETSYSFTAMVNNIGKFTASGIGLERSVTAMQGIATWAAISGQNAETATGIMNNLSQAMAMGYVGGRDWMSIDMANMSTKEFKETVIQTAKELKVLDKYGKVLGRSKKQEKIVVDTNNFKNTLSARWLSSEVLMKSLEKYGNYTDAVYKKVQETGLSAAEAMDLVSEKGMELGAKGLRSAQVAKTYTDAVNAVKDAVSSGWMKTWEILFGNIEEASELWTDFTGVLLDVFAASAVTRNELMLGWKELGGRDKLLEGISEGFNNIVAALEPIKEAFREIFPAQTAEGLYKLTSQFKVLMGKFKMGEKTAENIKRSFRGLFALWDIGLMVLDALGRSLGRAFNFWFPDLAKGLLGVTGPLGDFVLEIRDALKASDWFNESLKKFEKFVAPAAIAMKNFALYILDVVGAYLELVTLQDTIEQIADFFKPLTDAVADLREYLAPTIDWVKTFVSDILGSFELFGKADLSGLEKFMTEVRTHFKPLEAISNFFTKAWEIISTLWEKIQPTLSKVGKYVGDVLGKLGSEAWTAIKELDFDKLFDILNGGILVAILLGIKKFVDRVSDIFKPGSDIMKSVTGVLDSLRDSLKAWQTQLKAAALLTIANALFQVALAATMLSFIDPERLGHALAAVTILFTNLFATLFVIEKTMGGKDANKIKTMATLGGLLMSMAFAILILAFALKTLAGLNQDQLATGLTGVILMIVALSASTRLLASKGDPAKMAQVAFGLIIFTLALRSLAGVVKMLSQLDFVSMLGGLVILGLMLAGIVAFFEYADMNKISKSSAMSFVTLAVAIYILSKALNGLAKLSPDQVGLGLGTLALMMAALGHFIVAIDDKKIFWTAVAMNVLAVALLALTGVIAILGSLPVDVVKQGLYSMAGMLLAMAIALSLIDSDGVMQGALALGIVAGAVALLIPLIAILGVMNPWHLLKGLAALVVVIGVLVGTLWLLSYAAPAIGVVSWALAGLGAGLAALGAGMLVLAVGLAALATVGVLGFAGLRVVADILVYLFEQLLAKASLFLTKLIDVVILLAPKIVWAVSYIISEMIKMFIFKLPELVAAFMSFVQVLADQVPALASIAMQMIWAFLQAVDERIFDITAAGVSIVLNFISGISSKMTEIIDTAYKLIISFINGLAEAIRNNRAQLYEAVKNIIDAITGGLSKNVFKIVEAAGALIWKVLTTIQETANKVWTKLVDVGKNFINGIIEGIKNTGSALWDAAKNVVSGAVDSILKFLKMKSPSRLMMGVGENFDLGLVEGLKNFSGKVSTASVGVGESAVNGMKKAMSRVNEVINADMDFHPTISPIIDMSNINKGLDTMDARLAAEKNLNITGINKQLSHVSGQMDYAGIPQINKADTNAKTSPNYVFTQNNYSPKALDRIDIYRQTQNQIASLKGLVLAND